MALNVFGRRSGGPKSKEDAGLAVGLTDARVFSCPACARPLAEGTSRCPGCNARLIMGVLVRRAGAILALGMVFGIFIGSAAMASFIALSLHEPTPAAAVVALPTATVEPSVAPSAAARTGAPLPPDVPASAISALTATAVVNGRIAADGASLTATLAMKGATTSQISRTLRSLAADAALGIDLTGRMAGWSVAALTTSKLDTFYQAITATARDGLRVSLSNTRSYRATAASMLRVLATLDEVDAASRGLAATVGLELPPVLAGSAAPGASTNP